ncbi:Nop domain-containing protein [Suillus cothurnatus]|nr:Nop domain-containing protein [Suillus cothurnatus]
MLVLYETAMGYCLFKLSDSAKLESADLYKSFETPEKATKLYRFNRFTSTANAVEDLTAVQEGKLVKGSREAKRKETLVVVDPKLAHSISKKLSIQVTSPSPEDHNLKLKFSPNKVDTMIVQAIALLDDLDKEINIYSMRVKEWYGWHFPEMGKIIVVRTMGFRTNAATTAFDTILPEDLEAHIHALCDQVISITAYRAQLAEYLRNRMNAVAPNLTALVGDLVGARLISHAGSLLNLAKHPASTVQILGAEKALFRALKTKHDTPKIWTHLSCGLLASLIGQAPPKLKGKMARMVATKAALSIRVDALTDADGKSEETAPSIGLENRAKLESRLRALEHQNDLSGVRKFADKNQQPQRFEMKGQTKTYNTAADAVDLVPAQRDPLELAGASRSRRDEDQMDVEEEKESKDKKRKRRESEVNGSEAPKENGETEAERKARKKARKAEKAAAAAAASQVDSDPPKKKKKKTEV